MNETTVVYIAGYGRSGSTLLDLLLGRLDGWFSMGEFRQFWVAVRDGWRCGCGADVRDCPVWTDVLARADAGPATDVIANLRAAARLRHLPWLVSPRLPGGASTARRSAAETLSAVYHQTAKVAGARVIVDSSNDPVYGLELRNAPGVRLFVVHLVRDSRAVAWSWQRKRRRPEIGTEAYLPVHSAMHSSLEWDLRNALVHLLGKGAAGYTRLTYESMTRDPVAAVERISRLVTGTEGAIATQHSVLNHTVAGNPMRFTSGPLQVQPDLEWQEALGRRDRRLVTTLTWPLLRAYGYV
jgi:hypothetical protein